MNIAIYSQLLGSQHQQLLKVLFEALARHQANIWLHPLFAPVFKLWQQDSGLTFSNVSSAPQIPDKLDFIIVLGGDEGSLIGRELSGIFGKFPNSLKFPHISSRSYKTVNKWIRF